MLYLRNKKINVSEEKLDTQGTPQINKWWCLNHLVSISARTHTCKYSHRIEWRRSRFSRGDSLVPDSVRRTRGARTSAKCWTAVHTTVHILVNKVMRNTWIESNRITIANNRTDDFEFEGKLERVTDCVRQSAYASSVETHRLADERAHVVHVRVRLGHRVPRREMDVTSDLRARAHTHILTNVQ